MDTYILHMLTKALVLIVCIGLTMRIKCKNLLCWFTLEELLHICAFAGSMLINGDHGQES